MNQLCGAIEKVIWAEERACAKAPWDRKQLGTSKELKKDEYVRSIANEGKSGTRWDLIDLNKKEFEFYFKSNKETFMDFKQVMTWSNLHFKINFKYSTM